MKVYTAEEKKAYFQDLRDRWSEAKAKITDHEKGEIAGLISMYGLSVSPLSFYIVLTMMKHYKYDGLPYIDAKTFAGWRSCGFKVKKGTKSNLKSIAWIEIKMNEEDEGFLFPKEYHLFHRSQVEEIK